MNHDVFSEDTTTAVVGGVGGGAVAAEDSDDENDEEVIKRIIKQVKSPDQKTFILSRVFGMLVLFPLTILLIYSI